MENLSIAQGRYDNYDKIHYLISKQFDKGLTDKISFNQSASLLKEQEENQLKAESALEKALLDLKFWMGFPMDEELTISGDRTFMPLLYGEFDAERLPDYEAQRSSVDIAWQQYQSTRAKLYPTLSLKSGYGQSGFGEKLSRTDWYTSGYVGATLSIPLFSPTKSFSPKRQRHIAQRTEYEFDAWRQSGQRDYLQKIVLLNEAVRSLEIQRENVALAEENERLSRQKIEQGIIDMVQLKQVQQDLTHAQEALNNAQMNYLKQSVEINYMQSNE